jgi:hypothetical protein
MTIKALAMSTVLCLSFGTIAQAKDNLQTSSINVFNKELSAVNKELLQIQSMTRDFTKDIHEKGGVQISRATARTLRLNLKKVDGAVFNVRLNTLVKLGNKQGVYRVRDGYYKFLPAYVLVNEKDSIKILVNGVHQGDQIVLNGNKLLRNN